MPKKTPKSIPKKYYKIMNKVNGRIREDFNI